MTKSSNKQPIAKEDQSSSNVMNIENIDLDQAREDLKGLNPEKRLLWGVQNFRGNFAITTSFGIQSAVLLHMLYKISDGQFSIPILWIDTGYLPKETYLYAEELCNKLNLNVKVIQSSISPARMEALYGRLWETNNIKDIEKYHEIRKVKPLEDAFIEMNIVCWASGVRGKQTDHRKSMTLLDPVRNRLSIRPILEWNKKDIYYYMQKHNLPPHPLFEKGYSTIGDWHSSDPDSIDSKGRDTRFGGLKQECGIHVSENIQNKNNNEK